MTRRNYTVGPALDKGKGEWCATEGGKVMFYDDTQDKAVEAVAHMCVFMLREFGQLSELWIKGEDGKVRDARTYGNDPIGTKG